MKGWGTAECLAADFTHQTQGQVWRLILLVSSYEQQSSDDFHAASPWPEAMPSSQCAPCEAMAKAAAWETSLDCSEGVGSWRPCLGKGWLAGCAPLRLGGCLSLGGIMSSERNASAYE